MESAHRKLDYGTPTNDDEVMLPPHDRDTDVQDFPDTDFRDRQTLLDTQREDWLLKTEPLHGARPRQPGREHPPVIEDRPPLEATGGCRGPETGSGPYVVTRTADLDGRGSDNTTERESSDGRKSGFTTEVGGVQPLSLRVHHTGCKQYLFVFREPFTR